MILFPVKPLLLVLGLATAISAQALFVSATNGSPDQTAVLTPVVTSPTQTAAPIELANIAQSVGATAIPTIAPTPLPTIAASATPEALKTNTPRPKPVAKTATPAVVHTLPATASTIGYTTGNGQMYHNGQPIVLHGVNWSGFESTSHAPNDLWSRSMDGMLSQMQGIGVNALRIPLCPATLAGSSVGYIDYTLNPDLRGKNSLGILDALMAKMDGRGMYALLDLHRPNCDTQSDLWYTADYSEDAWLGNIATLASRYASNSHFVGIDLKNEPYGRATWGAGNMLTDWNQAAERAGSKMLATNSQLVAFIEGVSENPVCSASGNHQWGGNLEAAHCTPLQLPSNKIVYSPHAYGPDITPILPAIKDAAFPSNMPALWNTQFGYLRQAGSTVILGEWGGRYGTGSGNPLDVTWQNSFSSYLISNSICSSFYWSWDPESGDTGGILQGDAKTLWPSKVALLQHYWNTCH